MIYTIMAEWVFPVFGPPIPHGVVVIEDSRIAEVLPKTERRIDLILDGHALLPGLVNAHTHLDLTGAAGKIPPHPQAPFTDWLRLVIEHRRACSDVALHQDYFNGLQESLKAGVAVIADITGGIPSVYRSKGFTPLVLPFKELLGLSRGRAATAEEDARKWLMTESKNVDVLGLSPHAPYSVRQSLLASAGQLCRRQGHPLALHLAESPEEMELLHHRRGPMVEFLEGLGVYDPEGLVPDAATAMELVNVGQPKLFIHCNQLDPTTPFPPKSSVIYCPRTHAAFWPEQVHPFREFLDHGINVALGTDSLASNPDLDILAEARFLQERHPEIPGRTLLELITLNGAKALGLEDRLGGLARSYLANLVAVPIPKNEDCSDPHELLFKECQPGPRRLLLQGRLQHFANSPSSYQA